MKRKQKGKSKKRGRRPKFRSEEASQPAHSEKASQPTFDTVVALYQAGELMDASLSCRRLTEINPGSAEAWHLLGLLSFQLGHADDAIEYIKKAVSLKPEYAAAWNDLGNALSEVSQSKQAEEAYRRSIEINPGDRRMLNNLVGLLRKQGKPAEALEACEQAVRIRHNADSFCDLGRLQKDFGRVSEAVGSFRKALEMEPNRPDILRHLCGALRLQQRWQEARQVCEEWLRLEPENPVARHIHAALLERKPPKRAGNDYVRKVFDQYADSYDTELQDLNYQGPRLLMQALEKYFPAAADLIVLDAGCGTGLCGKVLKPFAKRLEGVDLSEKMLEKAGRLNCYDKLTAAELTDFLGSHPETYDLIVAVDTLNYFGDLEAPFRSAEIALRAGGTLIFTLERSDSERGATFHLNPNGRYSHSEYYIRDSLEKSALRIASVETATLRFEADRPVAGFVIRAIK